MEIHRHLIAIGSHPKHSGTQKKWTHYSWKPLMLFLAVLWHNSEETHINLCGAYVSMILCGEKYQYG